MKLIDKDALIAEIEKVEDAPAPSHDQQCDWEDGYVCGLSKAVSVVDTLEVKDPYEECIQYDSIKAGIQCHAETYSFNIESVLFNQLTKEQQELWRKEIEEACISGGDAGYSLARDIRYKENSETKNVDLEKEINEWIENNSVDGYCRADITETAEYFYELGLKAKEK